MRCEKCRREITGIGKPAFPPALPAIIAWGGVVWAMWSLTLGESQLPGWTPSTGWTVGLSTLGVATVLAWYALIRRKCPGCGATRMLQAMEEEGLLATERQAAQEQTVSGLRAGAESELRQTLAKSLRAEIEAELRAVSVRETEVLRGRLEKELRDDIGQRMRVEQAESERGLRQKLTNELRPEIEKELRPRIENELRPEIEKELRPRTEERLRPEIEKELRPRIVEKLRPEIEKELRPRIEEKLRPEIEKELRPRIEEKLRPEIEKELRASLKKDAQVEPEKPKTSPPVVESAPRAIVAEVKAPGKPAGKESAPARTPSPLPSMASPARSTPAPVAKTSPADVAKTAQPAAADLPVAKRQGTVPRFTMPSSAPAVIGTIAVKPAAPDSSKTPAPVAVKPSASVSSKSFGAGTPKASAPISSKGAGTTPAPVTDKVAVTPGPVTDPHERAERRARVIVSDLSLYHNDLLSKAAQATDAKAELGTLWRDAVLAYDRTVSLEVRGTTHYLEDELEKHLAKLRQDQAAGANPQHG